MRVGRGFLLWEAIWDIGMGKRERKQRYFQWRRKISLVKNQWFVSFMRHRQKTGPVVRRKVTVLMPGSGWCHHWHEDALQANAARLAKSPHMMPLHSNACRNRLEKVRERWRRKEGGALLTGIFPSVGALLDAVLL